VTRVLVPGMRQLLASSAYLNSSAVFGRRVVEVSWVALSEGLVHLQV